jgi:hypothetical protein
MTHESRAGAKQPTFNGYETRPQRATGQRECVTTINGKRVYGLGNDARVTAQAIVRSRAARTLAQRETKLKMIDKQIAVESKSQAISNHDRKARMRDRVQRAEQNLARARSRDRERTV